MITPWTIYWITRADSIQAVAVVLAQVAGIGGALFLVLFPMIASDTDGLQIKNLRAWYRSALKWWIGSVAALLAVAVFTPTSKECAAIAVIPAIANNQDFQALGSDLPKLAREWLEELRPKQAEKEDK
jgi:NADH:ubiquinone oxidoreductase subunit 6 (subunit J)